MASPALGGRQLTFFEADDVVVLGAVVLVATRIRVGIDRIVRPVPAGETADLLTALLKRQPRPDDQPMSSIGTASLWVLLACASN